MLTAKTFPANPDLDQLFTFGTSSTARGKIVQFDDRSGSTLHGYDSVGQLNLVSAIVEGHTYDVGYTLDVDGRLQAMEYPSGRETRLAYDGNGRPVGLETRPPGGNWISVVSAGSYYPNGPLKSLVYGDGRTFTATYDTSYRLIGLRDEDSSTGEILRDVSIEYTLRDNIAQITDNLVPGNNKIFSYSPREQLATSSGPWGSLEFDYDGIGNRIEKTTNGSVENYAYPPDSSRLLGVNLQSQAAQLTYDASGNVIDDGRAGQSQGYTYDEAGRMSGLSILGVAHAEYKHNALGQQVIRTLTQLNESHHSIHDIAGMRIAEYVVPTGAASSLQREYLWFGDRPVAVVENGEIYFIRTDHIGRPVFATSGNAGGTGGGGLDPRFDISNYIVLPGDSGANSIFGGSDPEWIDGGEGNDTLRGGGGDDYIIAGPGSNDWNIFGDGGNDIFQYSDGDGQIHVKDFVSGEDKIYVTGVSGFADLDLEVPSWNPTLTRVRIIGGQSGNYVQVLNNNSLTAADFLFDSDANAGGGNPGSGSTGGIVWQVSYRPFGEVHVETGDAIDLRFPGQWYQAESGLHQNWMRDYDPTTGRYLQPDPLGLVDGPSLYGYAMQNPGRYVDPRGEQIVVPGGFGGLGPAAGVAPGTKLGDALGNSLADLVQSIIPES